MLVLSDLEKYVKLHDNITGETYIQSYYGSTSKQHLQEILHELENENYIFSRIKNTYTYKSSSYVRNRISKFIEYIKLIPEQKK